MSSSATAPKPQAMLDTPQCNIPNFMQTSGGVFSAIGSNLKGLKFMLIGGGQVNLYLSILLALGGADVTVIEANGKVAGRAEHHRFNSNITADLGMMRFGRGQALWFNIVNALGCHLKNDFPDPGVATTLISYGGQKVLWNDRGSAPHGFERVYHDWHQSLRNGWSRLTSWNMLRQTLHGSAPSSAAPALQAWVNRFLNHTINSGLQLIFGSQWNNDDFARFGTLGYGSGGYGVYGSNSFLVIMRMMINGYEDNQSSIYNRDGNVVSAQTVVQALARHAQRSGVTIILNSKVTKVSKEDHGVTVRVGEHKYKGHHLVLGTTFPALSRIEGYQEFITSPTVQTTLCTIDGGLSGKRFGLVDVSRIPSVNNSDFPKMILSDGRTQQVYLLKTNDPAKRIVLFWYGWEATYVTMANRTAQEILGQCKATIRSIVQGNQYEQAWAEILRNIEAICIKKWPKDPIARTAFHNPSPQYMQGLAKMVFWWETQANQTGPCAYINSGDLSGAGGWNEPGFVGAVINASAIFKKFGTLNRPTRAPCNLLSSRTIIFN